MNSPLQNIRLPANPNVTVFSELCLINFETDQTLIEHNCGKATLITNSQTSSDSIDLVENNSVI